MGDSSAKQSESAHQQVRAVLLLYVREAAVNVERPGVRPHGPHSGGGGRAGRHRGLAPRFTSLVPVTQGREGSPLPPKAGCSGAGVTPHACARDPGEVARPLPWAGHLESNSSFATSDFAASASCFTPWILRPLSCEVVMIVMQDSEGWCEDEGDNP